MSVLRTACNHDDAEHLAQIQVSAWRLAYQGIMPKGELDALDVTKRTQSWKRILADQSQTTLIIEQDHTPIGFINIGACHDASAGQHTGEIRAIYVLPDYMHQGVGTKLLQAGLDRLRERKFSKVSLWVLKENRSAISFYQTQGLQPDGHCKTERRPGYDLNEIRLAMSL